MLKKGNFLLRNRSTNISLLALIIIGVDGYSFNLFFILIIGKIFLSTFLNFKLSIDDFFFSYRKDQYSNFLQKLHWQGELS